MNISNKIGVAALLTLWAATATAQEVGAPNYREIRTSIQNSKSANYYPLLMRRYLENDTTLTLEQYRCLYYGYTLQEDFVPYQKEREKLFEVRRELVTTNGSMATCAEAIKVAASALEDDPFDLLAISTLSFSYLQLKDTVSYTLWNNKQDALLDAIVSSGDGDDVEDAIHVINLEHEYEVLNRLGLQIESDSLCNDNVEYLKVQPNAEDVRGVFFNFGACRQVYLKKYE
ncbi:MAG: DUF4919 domain-containing protein [Bacteroidales bacterium]|jgi:hypothetical protein|nr:DUF4919 domain-containing protein [Bacteroidales bacterium]